MHAQRYSPHLVLEIPPGWHGRSRIEAVAPGGDGWLAVESAPTDQPTEAVARATTDWLDQLGGFAAGATAHVTVDGFPAVASGFDWRSDEASGSCVITHVVAGGNGFRIIAGCGAADLDQCFETLVGRIEGVRLGVRPDVVTAGTGATTARRPLPAAVWRQMRSTWSTEPDAAAPLANVTVVTPEELHCLLASLGHGVPEELDAWRSSLSPIEQICCVAVARRALHARRLSTGPTAGPHQPDHWLAELLTCLADPDLLVRIDGATAPTRMLLLAVTPVRATLLDCVDGVRIELATFDPQQLVAMALSRVFGTETALDQCPGPLEVTTLYRRTDGALVGGRATIAVGVDRRVFTDSVRSCLPTGLESAVEHEQPPDSPARHDLEDRP